MGRRMTSRIQLGAVLLSLAVTQVGCSSHAPAPEHHPIPVKVRAVEETAGPALARYSGTLEPAVRVDMAFRVGGYVETLGEVVEDGKRRPIDKGDFVKKGTVLARIRSSDYSQKVATAHAAVSQAKSEEKLADVELERSKKLFENKAITRAELDSRLARAESARANLEGAVAKVGEAGVALDDTVLRAPIDGVILARTAEVGMLVTPGQPALTVADIRTVKAIFGVPQALVEKLQVGSPVEIELDKTIEAKVTRIAPAADTKGRVFSVEAAIPNENGALRPGSVVSVHIPDTTLASSSLAVPLSAVVRAPSNPRGFSVFILDGQADRAPAHMRDVKLGQVLGNLVTVTDGLKAGERVVTVGSTLLRDGNEAVVIR
jgi:RND family efflux transporter MFP subunit